MHLLAAAAVDADEQEGVSTAPPSTRASRRSIEATEEESERKKAQKARKELEKRARVSLLERQREARRLEREEKKTKETETKEDNKVANEKKQSAEASNREQEAEERKKKRAEKIATQNRLAAEERERKRKQDAEKRALRKQEQDKIAEAKKAEKAEKQRKDEIMADKLKTVAHEAAKQKVTGPAYSQLMNTAAKAAEEAAENEKEAKERGEIIATNHDVLLGRGGATNAHLGNKRFRDLVLKAQPEYIALRSRAKKSRISKSIVAAVQIQGGRFLKQDDNGDWVEMNEDVAQKKASQALRENAKELKQAWEVAAAVAAAKEVSNSE